MPPLQEVEASPQVHRLPSPGTWGSILWMRKTREGRAKEGAVSEVPLRAATGEPGWRQRPVVLGQSWGSGVLLEAPDSPVPGLLSFHAPAPWACGPSFSSLQSCLSKSFFPARTCLSDSHPPVPLRILWLQRAHRILLGELPIGREQTQFCVCEGGCFEGDETGPHLRRWHFVDGPPGVTAPRVWGTKPLPSHMVPALSPAP